MSKIREGGPCPNILAPWYVFPAQNVGKEEIFLPGCIFCRFMVLQYKCLNIVRKSKTHRNFSAFLNLEIQLGCFFSDQSRLNHDSAITILKRIRKFSRPDLPPERLLVKTWLWRSRTSKSKLFEDDAEIEARSLLPTQAGPTKPFLLRLQILFKKKNMYSLKTSHNQYKHTNTAQDTSWHHKQAPGVQMHAA